MIQTDSSKSGRRENNLVIQFDAREPVNTSDNEYTLTGMRPGQHVITIAEVDASGRGHVISAVQGGRSQASFPVTE
jgi:hypothetical protein